MKAVRNYSNLLILIMLILVSYNSIQLIEIKPITKILESSAPKLGNTYMIICNGKMFIYNTYTTLGGNFKHIQTKTMKVLKNNAASKCYPDEISKDITIYKDLFFTKCKISQIGFIIIIYSPSFSSKLHINIQRHNYYLFGNTARRLCKSESLYTYKIIHNERKNYANSKISDLKSASFKQCNCKEANEKYMFLLNIKNRYHCYKKNLKECMSDLGTEKWKKGSWDWKFFCPKDVSLNNGNKSVKEIKTNVKCMINNRKASVFIIKINNVMKRKEKKRKERRMHVLVKQDIEKYSKIVI